MARTLRSNKRKLDDNNVAAGGGATTTTIQAENGFAPSSPPAKKFKGSITWSICQSEMMLKHIHHVDTPPPRRSTRSRPTTPTREIKKVEEKVVWMSSVEEKK